jgi:hypothetical protein
MSIDYKFTENGVMSYSTGAVIPLVEGNRDYATYLAYVAAGGETDPYQTDEEIAELAAETAAAESKLTGVLYAGVMCSATKEDMWGLASIKDYVTAGGTANFTFDNGNTLTLTSSNYASFYAVWAPFRASFF